MHSFYQGTINVARLNSLATKLLIVCLTLIIGSLVFKAQYDLFNLSDDIQNLQEDPALNYDSVQGEPSLFANDKDSNLLTGRLLSLLNCTGGSQTDGFENCLTMFQAINGIYLKSLFNAVLIATIIAFTMPLLAFSLAASENLLRSQGKKQKARCLELGLDLVPYIMWTILLAGLARGIYGQENLLGLGYLLGQQTSKYISYFFTLLIQYMGFAAFLIAFQSRSCARWLLELQENRIIDSMRACGLSRLAIYFRLFYFGYRPLYYLRQVLFTFIFILLFDYSLSVAKPIFQSGGPQMLFNIAGQFENARQESEKDLESAGEKEFLAEFDNIEAIKSAEFSKITQPVLGQLHFLNEKLVVYFEFQSIALILLVFSVLFIRFDFREFLDER